MKICDIAIERRTTVFVLLALIIVLGIYSYIVLPRESEPEIIIPVALVTVTYQGVSPEDMETLVTIPIERKLTGISGVKQIVSTSNEGMSTIVVEFDADVDVNNAIQKVKDKIDLARSDLPEDADEPIVRDVNMGEAPIIFVNLTGSIGLIELSKIAELLKDKIETVAGVLEVDVIGDVEREIRIEVDPIRAGLYGIPLSELVQIAISENVNTPAGSLDVGEGKYLVRVPGEIQGVDDISNLVVRQNEDGVVYLRDLAVVRDGVKEATAISRLDGVSSVSLVVSKRSGVNIVNLSTAIKQVLDDARKTLPKGVRLDITLDESTRIQQMIRQLENSILSGLVLVLIVTFLVLGFTNAFFVALAIPISLLITFSVMNFSGLTLNMVTLFSLMVSLGMLVDNGIVVVENIYRHAQMGLSRIEAAKQGSAEVAWPIFGSALTTIVAFFPMVFWPGMMGKFLNLLPKTVIVTLFASLFVGLIVNPALASVFVRLAKDTRDRGPTLFARVILGGYEKLLRTSLRWSAVTITAAVVFLFTIIAVFAANPKTEFLAKIEPDRVFIDVDLPEGANLGATDAITRQIEQLVAADRDVLDFMLTNVGSRGASVRESMPGSAPAGMGSHRGRVTLVFPPYAERTEQPSHIVARVRQYFDDIVGAEIRFGEAGMGPPSGPPVSLEISGDDFDELARLTAEIRSRIRDVPGLVDLQDNLGKGKPEVRIIVDREQARLAKLDTRYIGATIQAAIHGRKAGEYREGDDEYDVIIKFPDAFRDDLAHVEGMSFVNPDGLQIPFTSVARLERGIGLGSIKHVDRLRTVTIQAQAEGDRSGTSVLNDVQDRLADLQLPPGYKIAYTGENDEAIESGIFLMRAFIVALFLIALVLITQFNSIIQPFIIMSSVILSLGGVFFGLMIFDMPFGMLMTGIGCVSLSGIVVNNAIVLVDYINKLRERGMDAEEAIITAGKVRFRPVILTAVTTILGLAPLGLGISFDFRNLEMVMGGEQASYWGSMAVAIIFGLSFATVLTLVVVPALYTLAVRFEKPGSFGGSDSGPPPEIDTVDVAR